ncbi:hypothetical protein [Jatrophihabitans sp.]|uniref:hypothetical protein n=1 Tax=Jatrophihabitans sp. TaxID=1932789 RepID=UPI002CC8E63D|nr:hypothetical protein [Jatrophihabitans sp.]
MTHVFIHEAAHAVAALDRHIPFNGVFIQDLAGWVRWNATGLMLGGVQISSDPAIWLLPDPVAALEFVLAGSAAESVVLGHILEGSYVGDVEVWRRGMGETGRLSPSRLDELAGGSFVKVGSRTKAWVEENRARIRAVATALGGGEQMGFGIQAVGAGPWRLTSGQVAAVAS